MGELVETLKSSTCSITCLSGQAWRTRTGPEIAADIARVARVLSAIGVSEGMRIGIIGTNSYEWVLADLAALSLHCVSVAVPEAMQEDLVGMAARCGLALVVACARSAEAPGDPWIVHVRRDALVEDASLASIRSGAARLPPRDALENPTLVFSSGSSGRLKCLSISRAGLENVVTQFAAAYRLDARDVALVFLPLSNLQQRAIVYGALWFGLEAVVVPPAALFQALRERRPTVVIGPPLLFETVHARYLELPGWRRLAAGAAAALARRAPSGARHRLQAWLFRDVYERFGGRLRLAITGMAQIRVSTLRFFRDIGLPLFEAYGLTECGIVAGNRPGAERIGTVGKPLDAEAVVLAPDGEVLFRSTAPLSTGYFDEADAERTFSGSVIRTGDIGVFDDEGFLRLVGRKKEVLVTSGGFKIHPEVVESQLNECPLIAQSAALGGDQAADLQTVVTLRRSASPGDVRQIEAHVRAVSGRLPGGVRVGTIVISEVPFSVNAGTLTRNLKLDRSRIRREFGRELTGMAGTAVVRAQAAQTAVTASNFGPSNAGE